jgi:hypothetical protein
MSDVPVPRHRRSAIPPSYPLSVRPATRAVRARAPQPSIDGTKLDKAPKTSRRLPGFGWIFATLSFGVVSSISLGSASAPVFLLDLAVAGGLFLYLALGSTRRSPWNTVGGVFLAVITVGWLATTNSFRWTLLGPMSGLLLGFYAWAPDQARRVVLRVSAARGSALFVIVLSFQLILFGRQHGGPAVTKEELIQNGYDLPWARSNYVAVILVLGLAGCLCQLVAQQRRDRNLTVLAFAVSFPAILLTGSRTQLVAWLVLVLGAYFALVVKGVKRVKATTVVVIAVLIGIRTSSQQISDLLTPTEAGGSGFATFDVRLRLWRAALSGSVHSLGGHGLSPVVFPGYRLLTHNAILQIWWTFGWVGLFVAIVLIGKTFRIMRAGLSMAETPPEQIRIRLEIVALVALVISGMAENSLLGHTYDQIFWPLLSCIVATVAGSSNARAHG